MGRSVNSFTSFVGHAEETISAHKVTLPEKDLWVAVLCRAALDACQGPPKLNMSLKSNRSHMNVADFNHDQARHFFLDGGSHFRTICEMAGRNPEYVQRQIRKVLLRKNGWNVDVPITSHYRSGRGKKRGRPRKKKLTGNSYYAFIGRKGGRPRMYDGI